MIQSIDQRLSARLGIAARQIAATLALLDGGATVPFIARYRKEATAAGTGTPLTDEQITAIRDEYQKLLDLDKRRESILKTIAEQGKLTGDLRRRIAAADTLPDLEDLYLPYKQTRKTRAGIAIERGLEPLANALFAQTERDPQQAARRFISEAVPTVADALQGARDILAGRVSTDADARRRLRNGFERDAIITATVKKSKADTPEAAKFRDYFAVAEPLRRIPSHRLLALRRGEAEGFLTVNIGPENDDAAIERLERQFLKPYSPAPASREQVTLAIRDGYNRLLKPAIETEFDQRSRQKADQEAIAIFADNLNNLLLSPPLGQQRVLAIDPGFRTGCKVVCLDAQGNLLTDTVIYPSMSASANQQAAQTLRQLVEKHRIQAIAIGNGTAGRETETFVRELNLQLKNHSGAKATGAEDTTAPVAIFMVSEQGASIYSASEVARAEFPDCDVTVRGAVSIGRRLMDPLAELVKIDPKSIGVGQYQHDVDQTALKARLDTVVERCVNGVGVSLNTASANLLQYVSGLGPQLARSIVAFRAENGPFSARESLKKVPRLGPKAFEQCAGFLRIEGAINPLDTSAVHPERYDVVKKMAADAGATVADLIKKSELRKSIRPDQYVTNEVGLPTLRDILAELDKPGRDPRQSLISVAFDDRIRTIADLHEGMVLNGVVTNVTAFGAFVDIGVKQDGLVHISQLADTFVKDPRQVVSVQQPVRVKVVEVDTARKRIALTMKL